MVELFLCLKSLRKTTVVPFLSAENQSPAPLGVSIVGLPSEADKTELLEVQNYFENKVGKADADDRKALVELVGQT